MDVAGSRRKTHIRVPPAILVVAAVVAIGALVYVTGRVRGRVPRSHPSTSATADRTSHASSGSPRRAGSASDADAAAMTGFYLKSSVPESGAEDVASNTTISLTFSEPVNLKKAAPMLSPDIGGTWVQSVAHQARLPPAFPVRPLHPGDGDPSRRDLGPAGHRRDRAVGPSTPSPSTWRPATCCGCRSSWPGWTTCR